MSDGDLTRHMAGERSDLPREVTHSIFTLYA